MEKVLLTELGHSVTACITVRMRWPVGPTRAETVQDLKKIYELVQNTVPNTPQLIDWLCMQNPDVLPKVKLEAQLESIDFLELNYKKQALSLDTEQTNYLVHAIKTAREITKTLEGQELVEYLFETEL